MVDTIRLVVGFDQREAVAYHVFCQSVLEKASAPVSFLPLVRGSIPGYVEYHSDGSNHFTYSRFLVPYLFDYNGWAIFVDGDMVCNDDILRLWAMRDETKAVMVAKHEYISKHSVKYLGNHNRNYPRKNWSSVVLWNCSHPSNLILTPDFISSKDGAFLHRFHWLNEDLIGEIPLLWNWLATEYDAINDASLIHYTLGTPCFLDYRCSDMSDYWHEAFSRALNVSEES
jgi:hypothetical protein